MTTPSTRGDGRRPKSAKARKSREVEHRQCSGALWGFSRGGHRRDCGFGGEHLAGPTAVRALGGGWTGGKGLEPLAGGCYEARVRHSKASGVVAGR